MKQRTTKQIIQQSFRSLLNARPLDRITVRDIVDSCGLTRNTFYYYYEDIYDLFDDYLDTRMQEALDSMPPDSKWSAVLLRMLSSIFETPQMGRHIFLSRKRDTMRLYLQRVIRAAVDRYIDINAIGRQCSGDDRRLICDTCTHALYGLLEEWLTGPDGALLTRNLERVVLLFEGAVRSALQRSSPDAQQSPFGQNSQNSARGSE